jgi:hypothetical protein
VRFTQWLQLTIQKRIISRVLANRQRLKPLLFFKLFYYFSSSTPHSSPVNRSRNQGMAVTSVDEQISTLALNCCVNSLHRRYASVFSSLYLPKSLAADEFISNSLCPGVLDPSPIVGLPVSASQVCASSDAVRPKLLIV